MYNTIKWREQRFTPSPKMGGHSIVLQETGRDYRGRLRTRVTCECGKSYSGWGESRAGYSLERHQRDMGVRK